MICADNISLRPLQYQDSNTYFKWINDKELVEFNSVYKKVTKSEHNKWFKDVLVKPDIKIFSIVTNKDNVLLGSCSLRKLDFKKKVGELQIRIGEREFHNKGFGREAVNLLIEYGFGDLALNEIYLYVFEDNIRALKTYHKCFFKKNLLIKDFLVQNGLKKNAYLMSIQKKDFPNNFL